MTDDYKTAKDIAGDFFRKDIDSLTARIHDALERQRKELAGVAETLWDDKRKSEDFNKACLKIAALIRDGDSPDTAMYPGLSLVETGRVVLAQKDASQTGEK